MTQVVTRVPDLEVLVPQRLRAALPTSWVGRNLTATRPAVTIVRAGGTPRNRVHDQARLNVNVYAATDKAVNDLALEVQAQLLALRGDAIISIVCSGPAAVTTGTDGPQRFMYADVVLRRRQ